jgi:tetratricopeptide (TPR) repeat protein
MYGLGQRVLARTRGSSLLYIFLVGTAVAAIAAATQPPTHRAVTWQAVAALAYLGLLGTGAAYLLYSMDKDEDAIELFRAGMAANPRNYDLPHEFGMYYYHRHKWELAAEQFEKAVALGAPAVMQHMLPNALERAGRLEEALQRWREILKRYPGDPIAKRHIERLTQETGKGKNERTQREPLRLG